MAVAVAIEKLPTSVSTRSNCSTIDLDQHFALWRQLFHPHRLRYVICQTHQILLHDIRIQDIRPHEIRLIDTHYTSKL